MSMEATSFAKPHFGLGLAHTHHHPYTVVNVSKVVPNNTPNAQMGVQLQKKFVKQFEQGLLLPVPRGY